MKAIKNLNRDIKQKTEGKKQHKLDEKGKRRYAVILTRILAVRS